MVGRIDANISTEVQVARSGEGATPNKKVQKVANTQSKMIKVERNSSDEQEMTAVQAKNLVGNMNSFLMSADSKLKFEYHEELNEYYVTIINTETDEVIREIPSKKLMDIHAAMREFVGLLVDRKI